jgi:hypothetical protein
MLKTFLFILTYLCCLMTNMHAQKKQYYSTDDYKQIDSLTFTKYKDDFFYFKVESDSEVVNLKAPRIKKGKLTVEQFDAIKTSLNAGEHYFDTTAFLVIEYFPGLDSCNSSGDRTAVIENYEAHAAKIESMDNVKQFFIYQEKEGIEMYGNINWQADRDQIIQKSFFMLHFPCSSMVVIDRSGNYYSHRGEHNLSEAFTIIKKKKNFQP